MTAPTPLWLCLKIEPQKERKAHEAFVRHGLVALAPPVQIVRLNRHHRTQRQRTVEKILLPGYAFVSHNGQPDFDVRLLRIQFPADETPFRAIRGAHPGDIKDIVRNPFQIVERPVVHRILGFVSSAAMDALTKALSVVSDPAPAKLRAGDKAKILLAGDHREVQIAVVKGRKVRVIIDGREVTTTVDRLEAA